VSRSTFRAPSITTRLLSHSMVREFCR